MVGCCSALCLLLLLRLQQLMLLLVMCSCCLRRCRRPQHRLQLQGQRQGPHCRIKQGLRLSLSGPQDAQVDDVSVVSPALQRKRVPCRQDRAEQRRADKVA